YDESCLQVAKFLDYVDVKSIEDIQAGQVYSIRHLDIDDKVGIGRGGHTGIVLGAINEAEVLVLSYSREMPEVEGFGISVLPAFSNTEQISYFSVLDQPRAQDEIFALRESYLYPDLHSSLEAGMASSSINHDVF